MISFPRKRRTTRRECCSYEFYWSSIPILCYEVYLLHVQYLQGYELIDQNGMTFVAAFHSAILIHIGHKTTIHTCR